MVKDPADTLASELAPSAASTLPSALGSSAASTLPSALPSSAASTLPSTPGPLADDAALDPGSTIGAQTIFSGAAPRTRTSERAPELAEVPLIVCGDASTAAGELTLLRELGEGGMGRVMLAEQRSLRRSVAVKIAHDNAQNTLAILQEGVITGMLEHPNIPPIHSLGRDPEGRVILVMKRIEGVTWAEVLGDPSHPLRGESPLFAGDELGAHLEILALLCNALDFAHAQGVIHRDIKPENVMLGRYGEVYLIDWGVAFVPAWHADDRPIGVVGTPMYMAPEMCRGERPDPRTDVFLLGATLYEVLVGEPPHRAETVRGAIDRALSAAPPALPASTPSELAALCQRAMARDREARPASARAVREALIRFRTRRSSALLCDEAERRAAELSALLAQPAPDERHLAQLAHESRFGFRQALREWPENEAALRGQRALIRALAAREVALRNPRGARTLLAEIGGVDPEIDGKIAAVEAALAAERALEEARLAELRELDVRNAIRERNVFLLLLAATALAFIAVRFALPAPPDDDSFAAHLSVFNIWLAMAAVAATALGLTWRRLTEHSINRRWRVGFLAFFVCMGLNRILGLVLLPGIATTLASDILISGCAIVLTAVMITPRLLWAALPNLVAFAGILLAPEWSRLLINVQTILSILIFAVVLRARRAEPDPSRRGASPTRPAADAHQRGRE